MGITAMAEKGRSQPRWAGRSKDARGGPVTQLGPVMMHLLRRYKVIPSDALREIAKQVGIGPTTETGMDGQTSLAPCEYRCYERKDRRFSASGLVVNPRVAAFRYHPSAKGTEPSSNSEKAETETSRGVWLGAANKTARFCSRQILFCSGSAGATTASRCSGPTEGLRKSAKDDYILPGATTVYWSAAGPQGSDVCRTST